MPHSRRRVRELNDRLRTAGPERPVDLIVFAGALAREDIPVRVAALALVRRFDDFARAHDTHDYGEVVLRRRRVVFKIDYYNIDATEPSPDPSDPEVTRRVLTIAYANDY